ncbi:hypothetical protein GFV15_00165 [Lactococcus lactis]|uniref:hypothetical protein n=1 Tax=Lactococcus lactis TaxID=1358 RepID=UPI001293B390|nr:hypothetical protein [Lactococcus lactis]MQQ79408.1 hypothetical protein [Lactococcus lactis]
MTNETQIQNALDKMDLDTPFMSISNVRDMIEYLAKSEVDIEKATFEILLSYLDKVINDCHDNMVNYIELANLLEDEFEVTNDEQ